MELKDIIEAILFNSQKPLTPQELRVILNDTAERSEEPAAKPFKKTPIENIEVALEQIRRELEEFKHTNRLVCVAGSWQFVTLPEFAPWLKVMLGIKSRPPRLSQPALETLAVVAYRQPATRAEIEQVRGVAVDGVMQTLIERGLVEQVGRAEVVGRPALYGTTQQFLEYFGLSSLEDLPGGDELRRIPVQKPETLLTLEPGVTAAPPETPAATNETAEAPQAKPEEKPAEGAHEAKPEENQTKPAGETPPM